MWKGIMDAFDLVAFQLQWSIGDDRKVRIGTDPWIGSLEVILWCNIWLLEGGRLILLK